MILGVKIQKAHLPACPLKQTKPTKKNLLFLFTKPVFANDKIKTMLGFDSLPVVKIFLK
jgi:hypothetical protein